MVDGVEIGRCGGWVMWTLWRQNQKVDDVRLGQMDDVEAGSECGRDGDRLRRWMMWSWVRWTLWRLGQNVDDVELGQMDDAKAGSKCGRCGAGSVGGRCGAGSECGQRETG